MWPPLQRSSLRPVLTAVMMMVVGGEGIAPGAERTAKGASVALVVEARRDVADRQRDAFEDALILALVTADCPVHPAAKGERAVLKVVVHLEKWRASQEPGGVSVYDYQTGKTRRGVARRVDVRYRVRITAAEDGTVLREADSAFVEIAKTRSNPLWDPRTQAIEGARRKASREILRWICRAERKLRKIEAKKERKSR